MKLLFSNRSPLSVQLLTSILLALILIILDINYRPFNEVRYYLDSIVSPLYHVSNSPRASFDSLHEMAKTREELASENEKLNEELMNKKADLLLLEHLRHENNRLRELLKAPLWHEEHKMAAQVLLADTNPYAYQVVINKGKNDGVYIGQPIIDEKGIVGQIYEIAQNTSRAILVCDYQHAIPVQVQRNDISMVAVGNGCNNDLTLDFLPNNVDIKVGDVLVTSGLDGRFPEGYPVAIVTSVKIDISDSSPLISATPTADLKRLRYLLLLWGDQGVKHEEP